MSTSISIAAQGGRTYTTYIPDFTEDADVQKAFKYFYFGQTADPSNQTASTQSLIGTLLDIQGQINTINARPSSGGRVQPGPNPPTSINSQPVPDGWIWVNSTTPTTNFQYSASAVYSASAPTTNLANGLLWIDSASSIAETSLAGYVLVPTTVGQVGFTTRALSGQTANLSEWRDSSNNLLSSISALGDFNSNRIIYSTRLVESVTPNASGMGGTTTIDYSVSGNIYAFNGTSTANGTLNFTNLPTNLTNGNRVTTMTIIVNQGATGYIPDTIQINGVGQTVRWVSGTTPTPTNGVGKIDIFNFTLYRTGSLAWVVLGNANLNF